MIPFYLYMSNPTTFLKVRWEDRETCLGFFAHLVKKCGAETWTLGIYSVLLFSPSAKSHTPSVKDRN